MYVLVRDVFVLYGANKEDYATCLIRNCPNVFAIFVSPRRQRPRGLASVRTGTERNRSGTGIAHKLRKFTFPLIHTTGT